jgi:transposase
LGQITVFSGPERRRRWSKEDRVRILSEAFSPGACVRDVARRNDLSPSLIYNWRRNFTRDVPDLAFAQAVMAQEAQTDGHGAAIIIDLERVGRVSIGRSASPTLIAAALKALR